MLEIGSNAALVCGMEGRRTAVHNAIALDKHEFYHVGQCISMSILYGGPGPHFFSETAARYLLGLPIEDLPKDDVPDQGVVEKIEEVTWLSLTVYCSVPECNLIACLARLRIVTQQSLSECCSILQSSSSVLMWGVLFHLIQSQLMTKRELQSLLPSVWAEG